MTAGAGRVSVSGGIEVLRCAPRPALRGARGDGGARGDRGAAFPSLIVLITRLTGIFAAAVVSLLGPLPVAAASPSDAAFGGGDAIGGLNIFDLVTKGVVVVVLLFITLRVLGRMQATAPKKSSRLQVLESRTIAPKASLHLVAVGDRRLVVGLTPSGMVSLAELDAGELEAATAESGAEAAGAESQVGLPAPNQFQPAFAAVLNSMAGPVDALTGRIAGLFGGGRAR